LAVSVFDLVSAIDGSMLIQVPCGAIVEDKTLQILDLLGVYPGEIDLSDVPVNSELRFVSRLEMDVGSSMSNRLAHEFVKIKDIGHLFISLARITSALDLP